MKAGLVTVHYPRREHWDEMIAQTRAAEMGREQQDAGL